MNPITELELAWETAKRTLLANYRNAGDLEAFIGAAIRIMDAAIAEHCKVFTQVERIGG